MSRATRNEGQNEKAKVNNGSDLWGCIIPPSCHSALQEIKQGCKMTSTLPTGRDPQTGKFTTGNRFWEARSSHGRNPKFETADMLEDAIRQYFEWNESNPLYEAKLVSFQGVSTVEAIPKLRAMTIAGMCMFIGISPVTWFEWKQSRSDFSNVITWAEETIYRQKFEGASADLLNPNIIARDLGLADKKDHTTNGKDMPPQQIILRAADDDSNG